MNSFESDRDCKCHIEIHHQCPKCHHDCEKDWHKCPKYDHDFHDECECPKCHKDCHKCPWCNHDFHHECHQCNHDCC
jgi:hypothetical protein